MFFNGSGSDSGSDSGSGSITSLTKYVVAKKKTVKDIRSNNKPIYGYKFIRTHTHSPKHDLIRSHKFIAEPHRLFLIIKYREYKIFRTH